MTVAFSAGVRRGQVQVVEQEAFRSMLASLEGRDDLEVIIQPKGVRRTLSQNAFYHVVVHLIAAHTGATERKTHWLMKSTFLPVGVTSTSRLSRERFAQYVDDVTMWAEGWLGVRIPPRDRIVMEEVA